MSGAAARARLATEPLTREAFAPFGEVIQADGARSFAINQGTSRRYDDLARIDVGEAGGRPSLSIFRAVPPPLPPVIAMLERHPLGSQVFVPLQAADWLVVVAEGGDAPDPSTLRAFRAGGAQGVNFARGVWHHPLLVLAPQDFLILDRAGPGENLETVFLVEPLELVAG